jgi:hypothetical protein
MVKQAMARHGVVPIEKAGTIFQNSVQYSPDEMDLAHLPTAPVE